MSALATRRTLFGASAAVLALGTGSDRSADASGADGPLLALVARWHALQQKADTFPHADDGSNWSEFSDLLGRQNEVGHQIASTPARTREGLCAKARLLRALHGQMAEDDTDPLAQHTLGLLRDLLGGGLTDAHDAYANLCRESGLVS